MSFVHRSSSPPHVFVPAAGATVHDAPGPVPGPAPVPVAPTLTCLPPELLRRIGRQLDPADYVRFMRTCRPVRDSLRDPVETKALDARTRARCLAHLKALEQVRKPADMVDALVDAMRFLEGALPFMKATDPGYQPVQQLMGMVRRALDGGGKADWTRHPQYADLDLILIAATCSLGRALSAHRLPRESEWVMRRTRLIGDLNFMLARPFPRIDRLESLIDAMVPAPGEEARCDVGTLGMLHRLLGELTPQQRAPLAARLSAAANRLPPQERAALDCLPGPADYDGFLPGNRDRSAALQDPVAIDALERRTVAQVQEHLRCLRTSTRSPELAEATIGSLCFLRQALPFMMSCDRIAACGLKLLDHCMVAANARSLYNIHAGPRAMDSNLLLIAQLQAIVGLSRQTALIPIRPLRDLACRLARQIVGSAPLDEKALWMETLVDAMVSGPDAPDEFHTLLALAGLLWSVPPEERMPSASKLSAAALGLPPEQASELHTRMPPGVLSWSPSSP